MFGFRRKKSVDKPVVDQIPLPEVITTDLRDSNSPEMKRRYTVQLTKGRWMEAEFRTQWNGKRDYSTFVYQSNSKWLLIRFDGIADQVLDPELVPLIEKYKTEMFRLDAEFIEIIPTEYTDKNGTTWLRKPI